MLMQLLLFSACRFTAVFSAFNRCKTVNNIVKLSCFYSAKVVSRYFHRKFRLTLSITKTEK